jgi:hypothetical protein
VGDWALLYNSRFKGFKGKLQTRWLGPYEIDTLFNYGFVQICNINEERTPLFINGHKMKLYKKPLTKEEFVYALQGHAQCFKCD